MNRCNILMGVPNKLADQMYTFPYMCLNWQWEKQWIVSMYTYFICLSSSFVHAWKLKLTLNAFPSCCLIDLHSSSRDRALNRHAMVKRLPLTSHYFSRQGETVYFADWLLQQTDVLQCLCIPRALVCWGGYTLSRNPAEMLMDLWRRGKCNWRGRIPIWAQSHCCTLRFMMRMTQLITLGYRGELDMAQVRLCLRSDMKDRSTVACCPQTELRIRGTY